MERAHFQIAGHLHDAVDLGRLTVTARLARLVDHHVDLAADQLVALLGRDAILDLAEFGQPFAHQRLVDATVEIDGVRITRASGDGWHYGPARLAPGVHRLRVAGKAPARGSDARLDLRMGCAGTQHPSDARFRCDLK